MHRPSGKMVLEDTRCLPRGATRRTLPRDPAGWGDGHKPPQQVPFAGWVRGLPRVPVSASNLWFWGPAKVWAPAAHPADPHYAGEGDEDRLQRGHLCCVLHCNLQTPRAAASNCNHFSSLNFGFQCLKQASLGLAASVVPFGEG